jgi:hypothetical protein
MDLMEKLMREAVEAAEQSRKMAQTGTPWSADLYEQALGSPAARAKFRNRERELQDRRFRDDTREADLDFSYEQMRQREGGEDTIRKHHSMWRRVNDGLKPVLDEQELLDLPSPHSEHGKTMTLTEIETAGKGKLPLWQREKAALKEMYGDTLPVAWAKGLALRDRVKALEKLVRYKRGTPSLADRLNDAEDAIGDDPAEWKLALKERDKERRGR